MFELPNFSKEDTAYIFRVSESSLGGSSSFEKLEYVAYMGKLEVFWPISVMEVRRDDWAHTKPMGIESSKNISFQGQEWEMYM